MKIQFPLVKDGNLIVYPDDIANFSNTEIIGDLVVAEYHGELTFDPYIPPPTIQFDAPITKLAFRRLFNMTERVAFDNFEVNPGLGDEQKQVIRTLTKDYEMAEEVDMHDPDTEAGLQYLEACGILGPGRTQQILYGIEPGE